MKRRRLLILGIFVIIALFAFTSCSSESSRRNSIKKLYKKNEASFTQASSEKDFSSLVKIGGIQQVVTENEHVDIQCKAGGFASQTYYCGIFYSEEDDLLAECFAPVPENTEKLEKDGSGFCYTEPGGDNKYYVESLGNHYFYYETRY